MMAREDGVLLHETAVHAEHDGVLWVGVCFFHLQVEILSLSLSTSSEVMLRLPRLPVLLHN